MLVGDAKDAFDVFRVTDADLDVGFTAEACGGVERFAFSEDSSDGVEGLYSRFFT